MPYNLLPPDRDLESVMFIDGGKSHREELPERRNKELNELDGYIRDFDGQGFEEDFTRIESCLRVFQMGVDQLVNECGISDGRFYFTMEVIHETLKRLENRIDGYDLYVTIKRDMELGFKPYDWSQKKDNDCKK